MGISKMCRWALCCLWNPKRAKRFWAGITSVCAERSVAVFWQCKGWSCSGFTKIIFMNLPGWLALPYLWNHGPSSLCELLSEYLDVLNECVTWASLEEDIIMWCQTCAPWERHKQLRHCLQKLCMAELARHPVSSLEKSTVSIQSWRSAAPKRWLK